MDCLECTRPLAGHALRRYCNDSCKSRFRERSRMVECPICGTAIRYSGRKPAGEHWCRACRSASRVIPDRTGPGSPCLDCGRHSFGIRCKSCQGFLQRVRPDDDVRVVRRAREQAAPGLNSTERTKLLRRWQFQGKRCAYCTAAASTVDHVVPLVRGGTNFEGNLVPCCRPCNSSKAGHLLADWLYVRGARVAS